MRIRVFLCLLSFAFLQNSARADAENNDAINKMFPGFSETCSNHSETYVPGTGELPTSFVDTVIAMHHQWLDRQSDSLFAHHCLLENKEKAATLARQSLKRLKRARHLFPSFSAEHMLMVFWGELYAECSDRSQLTTTLKLLGCGNSNSNQRIKNHCALLKQPSEENRISCHHRSFSHQLTYFDVSDCRIFNDDDVELKEQVKNLLSSVSRWVLAPVFSYLLGNRWWVIAGGN